MIDRGTITISHSEVETRLACEMRHYYAFGDNTHGELAGLEPHKYSDSLFRGIHGHTALEVFYKAVKDGSPVDQAADASYQKVFELYMELKDSIVPEQQAILLDLSQRILPRYYEECRHLLVNGWVPKYVEHEFRLTFQLPSGLVLDYPFKPDLIITDPVGNLWVWDHKFVYNFYTEKEIKLMPQIPKYIGALRAAEDLHIKGGYYNMLRWRETKTAVQNKMEAVNPTDFRVRKAFRQQARQMEEIANLKAGSLIDWWDRADESRTLNNFVCKICSFKDLCISEINGEDTTMAKQVWFGPNSYGYEETAND